MTISVMVMNILRTTHLFSKCIHILVSHVLRHTAGTTLTFTAITISVAHAPAAIDIETWKHITGFAMFSSTDKPASNCLINFDIDIVSLKTERHYY